MLGADLTITFIHHNNYLVRIASKYYNDTNKVINIRMLVIYSANVKEDTLQNTLDFGAVKLTIEDIESIRSSL